MIRYFLDTDICVEVIRRKSPQTAARLYENAERSVAISSITLAELSFGVAKSSDPQKACDALVHFIAPLITLPFDDEAANEYGLLRARLERSGRRIGALDMLIAAQALAANLVLVTNNLHKFARIDGLTVESW